MEPRHVTNRHGVKEPIDPQRITERLQRVRNDMVRILQRPIEVSIFKICRGTVDQITEGISTSELDNISASVAVHDTYFADNNLFAGQIIVSNLRKSTPNSFREYIKLARANVNPRTGQLSPLLNDTFDHIQNLDRIEATIDHDRNIMFDFAAITQLINGKYLINTYRRVKYNDDYIMVSIPLEEPQFMFMRIALALNPQNTDRAIQLYHYLSLGKCIMATPTLFNAGSLHPQMSSCFLLYGGVDSIEGIADCWKFASIVSKFAGGLGIPVHNIRSKKSYIKGTNGVTNGIGPMLKVYNSVACYVDQCFHGDTRVMTSTGWRKIQSLQVNDLVMNRLGEFRPVHKIISTKKPLQFHHIHFINGRVSHGVTDSHPVLVIDIALGTTAVPYFVTIEELDPRKHWMAILNQIQQERRILDVTPDLLKILGIVSADMSWSCIQGLVTFAPLSPQLDVQWMSTVVSVRQVSETELIIPEGHLMGLLHCNRNDIPIAILFAPLDQVAHFMDGLEMQGQTLRNVPPQKMYSLEFCANRLGFSFAEIIEVAPQCYHMTFPERDEHGNRVTTPHLQIQHYFCQPFHKVMFGEMQDTDCYDLEMQHKSDPSYVTPSMVAHNGGGKRKGSIAIYLEPWHADILDFLELKSPFTAGTIAAPDLFYALWVNDLFMKRIILDYQDGIPQMWSFMNPQKCRGLETVHGDEFEQLYCDFESRGMYEAQFPIRDLVMAIAKSQVESGGPYILFKDHCNRKSNQQNLGTIQCSNLCTEIIEYSSPEETAVCNLCSVSLKAFIRDGKYDFQELYQVVYDMVYHMNQVIDLNYYPLESTQRSNMRHRPIGIGIQGLADVFMILKLDFDSVEAQRLNFQIAETMYFAALKGSHDLAQVRGNYPSIAGSPIESGIFQQDLWDKYDQAKEIHKQREHYAYITTSVGWDWEGLRQDIRSKPKKMLNSLLMAHMPTAGTSIILGNFECFEPALACSFKRYMNTGEYNVFNKYMVRDLKEAGLWEFNEKATIPVHDEILARGGIINDIHYIPEEIRKRYRSIVDIPLANITLMAADRARFIDQSQSLNVYMKRGDNMAVKIMNYWCFAWRLGLKTASYYFHLVSKPTNFNFTVATSSSTACTSCAS
jgi:ribonucleoside-diphosphate reductase alpha subunit